MSTGVGTESEAQIVGKADAPPVVQASHEVAAPLAHVWEVLVSPQGAAALLGEGAVLGGKGEPYHCMSGASGVVRSYHPLEQLRVSWHETPDTPASVIEVDLHADGETTRLDLTQDHLRIGGDLDSLRMRWSQALQRVAMVAEA